MWQCCLLQQKVVVRLQTRACGCMTLIAIIPGIHAHAARQCSQVEHLVLVLV